MLDLSILDTLPDIMNKSNSNFRWMLNNYATLIKDYPNKFVAIDDNKVIDKDDDIVTLLKRMKKNKSNSGSTIIEFVKEKKLN